MTTESDVEVRSDRDSISASGVVDVPASTVFDYLRRPANHVDLSGGESVRGQIRGPDELGPGDRFDMNMHIGVPYRITNRVVEYEPDHLIAWSHFNGHRWRWVVDPIDDGHCRVTETFDLSTAVFPPALRLLGFPARHRPNVVGSVTRLAAHFAAPTPT